MPDPDALVAEAVDETGLDDFGGDEWRVGLERLCDALDSEGQLSELGAQVVTMRLVRLLANRLRIEATYRQHPEIDDQRVEAPIFIVGLPRTGTTALSHLLTMDPQIRSLRVWESSDPVPPPDSATEQDDPRIEQTRQGLQMMYEAYPRMKSLYFQEATGPTECQDLLGMTFRAEHFDGLAHVPSYTDWVVDCDMVPAYRYHARTLRLLQWRCPPRLWHLKTPVHLLYLDALDQIYPDARFLWTHRDPAQVLGSVCDLIAYTRSWVSEADDPQALGEQQVGIWQTALRRGMAFRERVGDDRFADVDFRALNADPVDTIEQAYGRLGLTLGDEARASMQAWAREHHRGAHGHHTYDLGDFGLDAEQVRDRYRFYTEAFGV